MTNILLFALIGVAGVVIADQSEVSVSDGQPIESLENHVGERRVETPAVVLQLKYDRGELNKIYLAQFRKGSESWVPSVPARTNLCADLCHAGLGGSACGSSCLDMLPVGLQTALENANDTAEAFGEPRVEVCPALCENHLGEPLCNCNSEVSEQVNVVDWNAVCTTFCVSDGYVLNGCPACEESITPTSVVKISSLSRVLNTEDGWTAWCSVQCQQGHGGAACNCHRSPLQ
ncbi:uncharacterized protein LOC126378510 [Pectinophora gossypiella]|nr:uncharacterized protein LOC126378510 [Pectinophora gossypiella]